MRLEQREKELAAIGASLGANCRPCIEHHLPAGREAGLSETELADAVARAQAVRHEATELLTARVDELLGRVGSVPEPGPVADKSRVHELVALGRASAPTRTRCSTSTLARPSRPGSAQRRSRRR